jgi:hypothetical protein
MQIYQQMDVFLTTAILVDKAKALIDLEGKYKNNEIESLTSGQTKYPQSDHCLLDEG